MRISDWSSDVCSSDLLGLRQEEVCVGILEGPGLGVPVVYRHRELVDCLQVVGVLEADDVVDHCPVQPPASDPDLEGGDVKVAFPRYDGLLVHRARASATIPGDRPGGG